MPEPGLSLSSLWSFLFYKKRKKLSLHYLFLSNLLDAFLAIDAEFRPLLLLLTHNGPPVTTATSCSSPTSLTGLSSPLNFVMPSPSPSTPSTIGSGIPHHLLRPPPPLTPSPSSPLHPLQAPPLWCQPPLDWACGILRSMGGELEICLGACRGTG